jgi:hypothetical protein
LAQANINPVTGLATDYLNHFNQAIMMLELLPQMPDCLEDLLGWQPRSYPEHFAASNFSDRELAIAAYDIAEPIVRCQLDELADTMNAILATTCEMMQKSSSPPHLTSLAHEAVTRLKPLVARAGAVIHGADDATVERAETEATQAEVDALLER